MKNTFKLFGIAVLVAAIGLSMAACDTGSTSVRNDLPPAGDGSISASDWPLVFAGVVDTQGNPVNRTMNFTRVYDLSDEDWDIAPVDIADIIPGSEIRLEGSTLSLRLGTPREGTLVSFADLFNGAPQPNISITTGLRVTMLAPIEGVVLFLTTDSYFLGWLIPPDPGAYEPAGSVAFMYADREGTVRGIFEDEYGASMINMALRPGWNTVLTTMEFDPASGRVTGSMVTGTPGNDFRWVLFPPWN